MKYVNDDFLYVDVKKKSKERLSKRALTIMRVNGLTCHISWRRERIVDRLVT